MRPPRAKIKPKDEAVKFASLGQDKDGFEVKFINSVKGQGMFSRCNYNKGDFLLEYRGDVVTKKEYEKRTRLYHDALKVFLFEFRYNGKQLCIDAAREDGSLARLVNHDHVSPNSKMRTITVNGQPHLCLFAIKDIKLVEEITYNYGDSDWPWRVKVSEHPDCSQADVPMASSSLKDDEQNCKHDVVYSSEKMLKKIVPFVMHIFLLSS
ncbi:LOW QUALITY PROTEIN: N-lysine methyltransferase KMT5A-like [Neolamprologus brichardi]|uniref:LOW QUALITY PROTEIN: N-lysine methyltransferase KMT5A-like n=1 Tax=Neolamprologus brichardi TaxID=32507 RepID=UPI0016436B68|nr:LOW QUALITY PROTEIN: N-lysine methyltransferase KMT5A-like [Neolamprologus brichardi]